MKKNNIDYRKVNKIFTAFSVIGAVGSFILADKVEKQNFDESVGRYMKAVDKK